jgi:alkylated DNA repair dioxygenase AlkB
MTVCQDFEIVETFCSADKGWDIYQRLLTEQDWPDNRYNFAGRQFVLPRLQTWHADEGIRYSYSNNLLKTRPWTPLLTELRAEVETFLGVAFNSVLVNCYRDGNDYVGWHADDEAELGAQPLIASLSFGATRNFAFRHKKTAAHDRIQLGHGTLLVMQPAFQHNWLHSIPIEETVTQSRINLTFRKVAL